VLIHGRRVVDALAATLPAGPDGRPGGSLAELRRAWAGLVAGGAVEVTTSGPVDDELAGTLAGQALERLVDELFEPAPGPDGPRWTPVRPQTAIDLVVEAGGAGPTWLLASTDANLGPAGLDGRCLAEVNLT
jgi:hypothetical protein